MKTLLFFTTAVLVVLLAFFAESSWAEESYIKKYIGTLQDMSADVFTKASDTLTQVKESQLGQKVESWFDYGADYVRSAYDAVVETAQAKWDAITS